MILEYKYDLKNNPIYSTRKSPSITFETYTTFDPYGNILLKSKYTYDPSGNFLSEIGYPANQETVLKQYEYDPFGRPIKIIDAFHQKTEIQYDD